MNNEPLSITAVVVIAVAFTIGGVLFSYGLGKRRRLQWISGVALLIAAVTALFVRAPEVRTILTAFAAVAAVLISAYSIEEARRLRRDSIDRESRDRQERLLDKLIDWALKAGKCGYGGYTPVPYPIYKNAKIKMELDVLNMTVAEARTLSIEGQYMKEIAVSLLPTIKEDLTPDVQDIIDKLDVVWKEAMQYLHEYKEGKLPSVDNVKALRESAEDFTKKAAKITGRLILI